MNQVTNLVPYGLLSKGDQAQFCGEAKTRGMYEYYNADEWDSTHYDGFFSNSNTYRLIIKADEWYYIERSFYDSGELIHGARIGTLSQCFVARPATPAEIQATKPKELSLEEKVKAEYPDYEVEMLRWYKDCDQEMWSMIRFDTHWKHIAAQSMKGFAGYVYYAHPFTIRPMAVMTIGGGYINPIAVLFNK